MSTKRAQLGSRYHIRCWSRCGLVDLPDTSSECSSHQNNDIGTNERHVTAVTIPSWSCFKRTTFEAFSTSDRIWWERIKTKPITALGPPEQLYGFGAVSLLAAEQAHLLHHTKIPLHSYVCMNEPPFQLHRFSAATLVLIEILALRIRLVLTASYLGHANFSHSPESASVRRRQ